ncbi:MAG TPA: hypothetical protein DD490_30690 [Acidobacteria bacterium]|nr:hypothetical protein [Acidobacteriota bacterium]
MGDCVRLNRMSRSRNFLPLAGFLVCLLAFASYPFVFARFPVTRDVPWASWLLFALGLGLGLAGCLRAFRRPEIFRGRILGPVFGALSLLLVAGFLFLTVSLTRQIPAAANAPQVGAQAPDFTLPDDQGQPVQLASLLGSPQPGAPGTWVLLIFYRGYW